VTFGFMDADRRAGLARRVADHDRAEMIWARYVSKPLVEAYLAQGWRLSRRPMHMPHAFYTVLMVREW